ncbi:MAG: N-acetyltransferase family protein [Desulfobacteraceae bacterium]|nr:N-acetyltransferase family protein [Desulfobacteraceae bacterium]
MPVIPVQIRECEARDIASVTRIYAYHVLHGWATFEIEPPTEEEMERRCAGILKRGYPYLIAESGGEVVGYAYAGPYRPRPAYRFTVENSVYVRPECHRQGIGLMLMESLIAECGRRGFRRMIAVIGDSGNHASIGLHRSLGFEVAGVLPSVGFKFGRWVDSVLMQRELPLEPPSGGVPEGGGMGKA